VQPAQQIRAVGSTCRGRWKACRSRSCGSSRARMWRWRRCWACCPLFRCPHGKRTRR